jgi:hypothetical protein
MIEPLGKNLVFLFSTPRAGSTLLSAILGGHAKISCPNEPWFLLQVASMYDATVPVAASFEYQFARNGLRDLASREEFLDSARLFSTRIYNEHLRTSGKEILVDKTPRYYHILPFIHELFPEAKKIWLKRNLLDSAASFQSTWTIGMDEIVGEKTSSYSLDLTVGPKNFADFFDKHRGFELNYETLVQEPETLTNELCDFLQINRQANLHQYASDTNRVAQMANKLMGDKLVFQHSRPHQKSIGAWQKIFTREEVQKFLNHSPESIWVRMGYGNMVKKLREQNYSFASEEDSNRQQESLKTTITQSYDFLVGQRFFAKSTAEIKLKQHWWLELGKKLGFKMDTLPDPKRCKG